MIKYQNKALRAEDFLHIFQAHKQVAAVYLFGSHALNAATNTSDVDLAIVPEVGQTISTEQVLEWQQNLDSMGYPNTDIVILDGSDVLLTYEAVKHNRVLYAAPQFNSSVYFSKVNRIYLDFAPYLKKRRTSLKRRILGS